MADKGFQLKVLVPTDDGVNISDNGPEKALYYLMYNMSNRSYQLSGKIKTKELFINSEFDESILKLELIKHNVDSIICLKESTLLKEIESTIVSEVEIGIVLNDLIDMLDKKES